MENTPGPNAPKSPDRKTSGTPGAIWYLVAIGIGAVLLFGFFQTGEHVELPYGDLVKLVDQGAVNPNAKIERIEGAEGRQSRIQYSGLSEIQIGPYSVTGKVYRRPFSMQGEPEGDKRQVAFHTARSGLENDANWLFLHLREHGFDDVRGDTGPTGWRSWLPSLLFTGLCIFLLFFILKRIGGTGSAMAFGRSRGRLYAQEEIDITFHDVAGIDEAVEEVREVVDFLKNPEKYHRIGGRIPKGVLLVGAPGTGKTLLAKAIAGEAGVPFFSLSGSDFVEMFVGVGAARVRDMFQQAQAKAPCIIFIDELDALGKTRGTGAMGGHDEREQTLNALLVEMDGFAANIGVIVLAATNRPETLDPALLRPGRFDRNVLVDRPDVRGREAILKVHVKRVKLDDDVDLKNLAAITSGFVGADLANLINEAALLAARKGKTTVSMAELNEAVERVTAGLEKKQRIISQAEKKRVAYHESAHALVALSLPGTDPVHKVSIIPRGLAALGYTMQRPEGDRYLITQSELQNRIAVLLAGSAAEEMIFQDVSSGAQNDLERATEIARGMVMDYGMSRLGRATYREAPAGRFLGVPAEPFQLREHSEETAREIDQEIRHIIETELGTTRSILETRRDKLVAIAERLLEKETLEGAELLALLE